jgi:S-adenosylmethionine hydrolase
MDKPLLVLQTDFNTSSGNVASMYGVIKQVDQTLGIYDLNHNIPPYNTMAASALLKMTMPFWPKGTIFVSAVSPDVCTGVRACVAKTFTGYYIATPDNGTLTYPAKYFGIDEARVIDEIINRYKGKETQPAFNGRDIFAYCAAKLASGITAYEGVGPAYPVSDIVLNPTGRTEIREGFAAGQVSSLIPNFGNLYTNIDTDEFERTCFSHGEYCRITITVGGRAAFDKNALFHKSFGYASVGEPILFIGSSGFMGLALNQGDLLKQYFTEEDLSVPCTEWGIVICKP